MARISLCMIARDEEELLPRCLASVVGAVDEIVLVDTGSSDATAEIAEASGARVIHLPWRDDFAAARNASLDAARGTHVLVLDADEVLAPGAGPALEEACEHERFGVGMLPLHDADALDAEPEDVLSGERRLWPATHVPRLFVADPALRYRRRVHETLPRELAEILRARRAGIEPVAAAIVHYGEVPALRERRGKEARNTRLLERALAEDPSDHDLAGYLATRLARADEGERAVALAAEHLPALVRELGALPRSAPHDSPVPLARVLASLQLAAGNPAGALESVRAALPFSDEHPDLVFLEAAALERSGELAAAEKGFRRALALAGHATSVPVSPGVTDENARLRLANVLIASERAQDALPLLEGLTGKLALAAGLAGAEAELALDRPADALRRLAPLLSQPDPPPDLFALAAGASARLGAPDPSYAKAAHARPAGAWLEPRRRALLG